VAETVVSSIVLEIFIGASFTTEIIWRDENGDLVPLPSGTIVEATVRPRLYSEEVLCRFSTDPETDEGNIDLTDPGVTTLTMTPENTVLLSPITGAVFDLRYEFAGGIIIPKLTQGTGLVNIRMLATRD